MWNAHGPIQNLISDNGTNLVGAKRFLESERKRTIKFLNEKSSELSTHIAQRYGMSWQTIPAKSPWFGAFYERLIKELKRAIECSLKNKKLSRIELNIALHDACYRVNLRPLTHNPVSNEDERVLTPHELATGRAGWPYLPGLPRGSPNDSNDRDIFKRGRRIADELMKNFTLFYLPVLTKRVKWLNEGKTIGIGDLVLIIEPNQTRSEWERGRVVKLYPGSDGRSRVADVAIGNEKKTIRKARSIGNLAKLEIMSADEA
jgi:hypothetical protein